MKKQELVAKIAEVVGASKKDTKAHLDATIDAIKDALVNGEKIQFVGFGSFGIVERKARNGVNPQTSKKIKIPASKTVKFRVGKTLKEAINVKKKKKAKKKKK